MRRPTSPTSPSARTSYKAQLDGMLEDIETVPKEDVAMEILALQTRLQASYQATSLISSAVAGQLPEIERAPQGPRSIRVARCASGGCAARRPAATSRLMLISTSRRDGSGRASSLIVWFSTNRPRLAMFWRIAAGSGFSSLRRRVQKHVPELAVELERAGQLGVGELPVLADALQVECRFGEEVGFQIAGITGPLGHRLVGLRRVLLHLLECPARVG